MKMDLEERTHAVIYANTTRPFTLDPSSFYSIPSFQNPVDTVFDSLHNIDSCCTFNSYK